MRGNNPMLTSKLHVSLNILAPCWDIHKTSITGILSMMWSKWGVKMLCQLRNCTFCLFALFVKYLSSILADFHKTSVTGILDEMIKMKGNSKLHVLLNTSALCWQIFIRLLYQEFFWWDHQNEGVTTLCYLQNCMFSKISCLLDDGFSCNFYNRYSLDETIKMRGTNTVLTLELHVFLNILATLLTNFHKTSITGILLMRWLK